MKLIKTSHILTEDTLTIEEKAKLWEMGAREVNVKACSNEKLRNYYSIGIKNKYGGVVEKCIEEADHRGILLTNILWNLPTPDNCEDFNKLIDNFVKLKEGIDLNLDMFLRLKADVKGELTNLYNILNSLTKNAPFYASPITYDTRWIPDASKLTYPSPVFMNHHQFFDIHKMILLLGVVYTVGEIWYLTEGEDSEKLQTLCDIFNDKVLTISPITFEKVGNNYILKKPELIGIIGDAIRRNGLELKECLASKEGENALTEEEKTTKSLKISEIVNLLEDQREDTLINDLLLKLVDVISNYHSDLDDVDSLNEEEKYKILKEFTDYVKLIKDQINSSEIESSEETLNFVNKLLNNCETNDTPLTEDIEKHETLNPKLWNKDGTLKEEVHDKILQIANDFIDSLKEDGVQFDLKDIRIVGSNCSYNYTKDSDLDVHLIADSSSLDCPHDLYPLLYSSYRSIFNKNLDIDFYGIPVEIYVEVE